MTTKKNAPQSTSEPYQGRRITLCVCGGIAAYKAAELLRLFVKADAEVQVVMTPRAREFVGAMTFQALSGRAVFTDMFHPTQEHDIGHIRAADHADIIVVAPATASRISSFAAGRADEPVASTVLAAKAPVLLAPAMNVNMWDSQATQRNMEALDARGMSAVGPGAGVLACRWVGPGRMAEPQEIFEAGARLLTTQDLVGQRIVVTAGPTHEAWDPVRFLGNRSTGRMGYAIAAAALRRGAHVELVSGPSQLDAPAGAVLTQVTSARDMHKAVIERASDASAVVMAAAVADYRPETIASGKRKKSQSTESQSIALARNPDILAELGEMRAAGKLSCRLIGFAAETDNLISHARDKLRRKQCDVIVANDVAGSEGGFGSSQNEVVLVSADAETRLPMQSKAELSHRIVELLLS